MKEDTDDTEIMSGWCHIAEFDYEWHLRYETEMKNDLVETFVKEIPIRHIGVVALVVATLVIVSFDELVLLSKKVNECKT